ncbi:MAG: alpha/beta fold hydrolase, partial [Deltaproteobacteria bacterium]|nr:alpha/beta fold hydrolase [Deltaproteobacteria bacterium]
RYHRRGFAGSDRHAGPFSIEDQAQDAVNLLEHLGVERAHVVGHSYGGVTAIQVALSAPRIVHSLSLLEPPLMPPELMAAFAGMLAPAVEAYAAGDGARAVDQFMALVGGADWRSEVSALLPDSVSQAETDAATRDGCRDVLRRGDAGPAELELRRRRAPRTRSAGPLRHRGRERPDVRGTEAALRGRRPESRDRRAAGPDAHAADAGSEARRRSDRRLPGTRTVLNAQIPPPSLKLKLDGMKTPTRLSTSE